jgi:hypothetical protein
LTALTAFDFEAKPVRAFEREDGAIWFVAGDVCRALDIKNSRDALAKLDDDEKGVGSTDTLGGPQGVNIISEGGLYTLVLRSRQATTPGTLPHRFRKWVTAEVLPAIRRTGRYEPEAPPGRPAGPEHELGNRLRQVELYRLMHGPRAAAWMAEQLGFPRPPAHLIDRQEQRRDDRLWQRQGRNRAGLVRVAGRLFDPDAEGWEWDGVRGRWTRDGRWLDLARGGWAL